ncbi:hypothetical protein [Allorhodopirellula solitaria]|uniref:Uncharacterized protein n=1 Tax=Allorhodopirellula solitaria TaxID=2527987 RepID=A0A5C5WYW7_9BACT|nr:hypothetical protein [Allorhodopirellula solitaria]TWT56154.1 hypothetical protein CA85_44960 [Allorhodopirellula solitaria]
MILKRGQRTRRWLPSGNWIIGGWLIGAMAIAASLPATAEETLVSTAPPPTWSALTKVFQGDAQRPAETHQIAYQNGVYYDFSAAESQPWVIFDLGQSRVIMLDRERQQRTSIATGDLVRLTARAESEITDEQQRARFGMDAQPMRTSDLNFALDYEGTRYRISGMRASNPDVAAQYGRFVDWVCRLNIARPRGVPPFARMKLNEMMTSHDVLPEETKVTLTRYLGADRIAATIRLRSSMSLQNEIDDAIASQIQDAQTMRVVFEEVPWDQYEH